jgi:hypothetical protein
MCDHVAGPVDAGDAPESAELSQHPFGAALLEECGSRNAADLQMLFVNPGFFPGEPLEGVAEGRIGEFGDQLGERSRLTGGRRRFGQGGQMSV